MGRVFETTVTYAGIVDGLLSFIVPIDLRTDIETITKECYDVAKFTHTHDFVQSCGAMFHLDNQMPGVFYPGKQLCKKQELTEKLSLLEGPCTMDEVLNIVRSTNKADTVRDKYSDVLEEFINFKQPPIVQYLRFFQLKVDDLTKKFGELEEGAEYKMKLNLYASIERVDQFRFNYKLNLDIDALSKIL